MKMNAYNDFSPEELSQISDALHNYTTALVRYKTEPDKKEVGQLAGSGTFGVSSNVTAILTAGHVVENLAKPFSLGLSLKGEHKHVIDSELLTLWSTQRGGDPSAGPDLGLIILPAEAAGWIKARQSFYNLDVARQYVYTSLFEADIYAVAICGVPEALKRDRPSRRGFSLARQYTQLCLFGSAGQAYEASGYDYCDVGISEERSLALPETFEGMSGGGLWLALLRKPAPGVLEVERCILQGVAFYEARKEGRVELIKCHGPMSIYDKLWREIKRRS